MKLLIESNKPIEVPSVGDLSYVASQLREIIRCNSALRGSLEENALMSVEEFLMTLARRSPHTAVTSIPSMRT